MDFRFAEARKNTRFAIRIFSSPGCDNSNAFGTAPMYCFLEQGSFCIGGNAGYMQGLTLSLEIAAAMRSKCAYGELYTISPSIMLQILKILEAMKKDTDFLELETMAFALYSSSSNFLTQQNDFERIDFYEAQQVYAVVQEWKTSAERIKRTLKQYKPAGMTRHKFVSLINQLYNCSAAQLVYDLNMQKAMNMLLTSDESIITVSKLSGYTNKENFITAFRNTYGVTPGYLRKHFR